MKKKYKKTPLKKDIHRKLITMINRGNTKSELARKLDISRSTLGAAAKRS